MEGSGKQAPPILKDYGTIPYDTLITFNNTIQIPINITELSIEATSDYETVSYISKIIFTNTSMSYNDGNTSYAVYSNGKWADTDAQNIIVAAEHKIQSATEKQWWLNNSDLTEGKLQ